MTTTAGVNEEDIRLSVRDTLKTAPIQKIIGRPTTSTTDQLEIEVGKALSRIGTNQWGGRSGHLATVLDEERFRASQNNPTATVDEMQEPPLVPAGLTNASTYLQKAKANATLKVLWKDYTTMNVVKEEATEYICNNLIEKMYVEELEDEYMGYRNTTPKQLFTHIRTEWCEITTLEQEAATRELNTTWNRGTEHVSAFKRRLDKAQKKCIKVGASAEDKAKVQIYVKEMYKTGMFDQKELSAYENKPAAGKDWNGTTTYFAKLIKDKDNFAASMANQGNYESASFFSADAASSSHNSLSPSSFGVPPVASFERDNMSRYTNELESVVESKTEEIAALVSQNDQLVKAIADQGIQLQKAMAEQQAQQTKAMMEMFTKIQMCQPTAPAATTPTGGPRGYTRRKRVAPRTCGICKKPDQIHEDDDCWDKPGNEHLRPRKFGGRGKKKEGE